MLCLWLLCCWALLGAAFGGQEVEVELGPVQEWASSDLGPGRLILSCFCGIKGCGKRAKPPVVSGPPRVINGQDALPGCWPWMVSLQDNDGNHLCAGTLISKEWVLTAYHCMFDKIEKVVAGTIHLDPLDATAQVLEIAQVFNHTDASIFPLHADIALIKLATPARFTDTVSAVCLACDAADFPPGTPCFITGWGWTHESSENSNTLQQAKIPLVSESDCLKYWSKNVTDDMICAGGQGTGPCMNDSGGPLVCKRGGIWIQVGIVSWGSPECDPNIPAVFTRITALLSWVKDTVRAN